MTRALRAHLSLLALPALGIVRLLPETGTRLGLRLGAATACLLIPGFLIAARAACAGLLGRAGVEPRRAVRRDGGDVRRAFVALARVDPARRDLGRGARRRRSGGRRAGTRHQGLSLPCALARGAAGVGFGIALWFLMRHLTGGDDSSTSPACGSSTTSGTSRCARSTSSATAGCTPGTRSRSGTASSRSSPGSPGSTRPEPCSTRPRARPGRVPRRVGVRHAGVQVGLGRGGGARRAGGDVRARGRERRVVHSAGAARDRRAAVARPGCDRALLRLGRRPRAGAPSRRSPSPPARSRSSTRPTRCSS